MEYVVTIFGILTFIAFLALVGFLITLIIGKSTKNNKVIKVAKIGSLCLLVVTLVSGTITFGAEKAYENELADNRRTFREYAKKFDANYFAAAYAIELNSNDISDTWYDALGDDNMSDQVQNKIDSLDTSSGEKTLKELKTDLTFLKTFDTGDLDLTYKDFQKAYNKLSSFYDSAYNPSGMNYSDYTSETSKLDKEVSDYAKRISEFSK